MIRVTALALLLLLPLAARAAEPFDPFHLAGIDRRPGARAPLKALVTDEHGQKVRLEDLSAGRPILLAPVQHRCPNICGFTLEGLAEAVRDQRLRPGRDVEIVAFGFDPREGPADAAVSKAHLSSSLGGEAGLHAVVADPAATKAVLGGLGYRYAWDPRMSQYAHIAAYAVLAPDGRLGGWVYGLAPAPDALAKALADAQSGRTSLAQQFLLLCYHFAPLTGRYDPAVDAAMRIAGLATAAALAAFVALALWRERRPRGAR